MLYKFSTRQEFAFYRHRKLKRIAVLNMFIEEFHIVKLG